MFPNSTAAESLTLTFEERKKERKKGMKGGRKKRSKKKEIME